ncbi:MAG: biotin/lipoyl-binding protein [Gammaproteobacteria bacterium]|nr:MAG: biotin/lipoyl-binding protein [Gammaproteobacteria bacterium]UTW42418.1 biotin/lipoyl-binding protein [bacterium SCSIO 12844]
MKIYAQKKLAITLAVVIIVVIISLSLVWFKSKADSNESLSKGVYIQVEKLKLGQYQPIVLISATAISRRNTSVSSFLKSRIEVIHFKVGQKVKKGQLLIELDPEVYTINLAKEKATINLIKVKLDKNNAQCKLNQSQLTQAKSLLELAQSHYERLKSLHESTYTSESELDISQEKVVSMQSQFSQRSYDLENCLLNSKSLSAELDQAEANLRLAEKNIKETKVYAPYDGIITDQYVSVGRTVNQGERLFSIYDPNATELEGVIHHKLYQALTKISLTEITACQDLKASSNCFDLKRISDNVSKLGTGHVAYFSSVDTSANIPFGKTIKLYLKLPEIQAFKVPISAIYHDQFIYTVKDDHLFKHSVELTGRWLSDNGQLYQLIKPSSLAEGTLVMLSHIPGARSGLKVSYQTNDHHLKQVASDEN